MLSILGRWNFFSMRQSSLCSRYLLCVTVFPCSRYSAFKFTCYTIFFPAPSLTRLPLLEKNFRSSPHKSRPLSVRLKNCIWHWHSALQQSGKLLLCIAIRGHSYFNNVHVLSEPMLTFTICFHLLQLLRATRCSKDSLLSALLALELFNFLK